MWRFLTLGFSILFALMPIGAKAGSITLILSETSGPYAEFTSTLTSVLAGGSWQVTATLSADNLPPAAPKTDLIVTAGAASFRLALNAYGNSTPMLATLLPRQSYEKTLAEANLRNPGRSLSAIWLDQPFNRQASFLRHLLPNLKRVGVLSGNETRSQLGGLRQAMSAANLQLDTEEADADEKLLNTLNTLLPRIGVLLALPDNQIYRRENIKAILVSTYRHQKPLVAFSRAFVSAGALAALYTTPSQLARQTADVILNHGAALPAASYPTQFAVAINHDVAHSLGFSVPDEATIRQNMLSARDPR